MWQQLVSRSAPLDPDSLAHDAVVFAPHQDDETLGCGGAIVKKVRRGAKVTVVFMTDGSTSHSHLMPPAELAKLRAGEATAACARLGVAAANVHLLNYPDGALQAYIESALAKVTELLSAIRPRQVFVPYVLEPPLDHLATRHVVQTALSEVQLDATVLEYPVWAWHHWPWVGWRATVWPRPRRVIKNSAQMLFGARLLQGMNTSLFVGDVLEQKRCALAEHRSQMTALRSDVEWLTLNDVSNGDWLRCFFRDFELFHSARTPL